jgi:DNA polymerase III delta' subunit
MSEENHTHIALPLKYRPMTFEDVVGQEHVTRTLRHAIESGRIANAYLFVGSRGIGKTTLSRIFAKAINCSTPNGVEPCGECSNCRQIAEGRSLDVTEIDGASHNKVEDIHQIIDAVQFAPTSGKYKIFIVDEVHMLTTAAFNALLKTLEEPPPYVRFIFATTEGDKVLPTIISRCQRFDLRRIQTNQIVERLEYICSQEKIEATYPYFDAELNKRYKVGKAKIEQLEDPISLSSPTQLAILFYDILRLSNKSDDRSTGEEALTELSKHSAIASLLLERRGVVKLLDAFINSLPKKVNPKTGKIHCSFHQYGAATGRFSSSEPNLQQVPSHAKNIRMLFTADTDYHKVEVNDNYYEVPIGDEVETVNGWKNVKELVVGDIILGDETKETIIEIKVVNDNYLLYV